MNNTSISAFIGMLLLLNLTVFSQPKATIQFIGGYSHPMADLKGSFGDIYAMWTGNGNPDTNTYFMKSGINYGIFVKFPLKKKIPVNIIGGVGFNVFSNSKDYDDSTGTASFDLTQSILNVTLGAEYSYYSKHCRFIPFAGVEAMMNIFGGKLVIEEGGESTEFNMNSTTRFGIQFGAGVDYILHQNIGITVGGKYAMANIFGKEYKPDVGKKYNLGDGEHTSGSSYYPNKKINYLQFYGGLSFYFGR